MFNPYLTPCLPLSSSPKPSCFPQFLRRFTLSESDCSFSFLLIVGSARNDFSSLLCIVFKVRCCRSSQRFSLFSRQRLILYQLYITLSTPFFNFFELFLSALKTPENAGF